MFNQIRQVHLKRPGTLLTDGLQAMAAQLPRRAFADGDPSDLVPIAMHYLRSGVQGSGKQLSIRSEREMCTLATALDHLADGQLAAAGDVLMQRFKACETAENDQGWSLAQRLELIPDRSVTTVSSAERSAALKIELSERKLKDGVVRRKGE